MLKVDHIRPFVETPIPAELFSIFAEAMTPKEYPPVPFVRDRATYPQVFLVTGGVDSTIQYFLYHQEGALALYMDVGQPYKAQELRSLEQLGIAPAIITFEPLAVDTAFWQHIIPARNLLFLLRAARYVAPGGTLFFAATGGELPRNGGDKSRAFLEGVSHYLAKQEIRLRTMASATKNQWAAHFATQHNANLLLHTTTCYQGGETNCGECQACLLRYIALVHAGLPVVDILTTYAKNPLVHATDALAKYREVMSQELRYPGSTYYGTQRAQEILTVIGEQP